MPVGALAVSNLLIWTFAEFIFSLSVLTVEWKSRQMCEFFASGGWEENDILLDNLQLLCFSRSFYSSERGVPGCRGGTVLSSPAWKSFFGGEESRVFLGSQACARGLLNMCRAGQKGGFPGGCVFFCLCRAGVYGLFLDVRRVGGWRLFHGQGSGTVPGRLTEGRLSGWRLQGC